MAVMEGATKCAFSLADRARVEGKTVSRIPDSQSDEPGDTIDAHVGGNREGFHYKVYYSPINKRESTDVYVRVYRELAIGDDRPWLS